MAGGTACGAELSGRLRMLADMVAPGSRLADVGCDHGFLSIYLVQAGICPSALAMDLREGPLAGARRHVEERGLGDYITLRLSDGLAACGAGDADTLVCAGMGGLLMERILREGMDRARGMRELIFQPQSEIGRFRAFLREAGLAVVREDAVCEDGKYYFAMKAVWGAGCGEGVRTGGDAGSPERDAGAAEGAERGAPPQELADRFGGLLLAGRHPVLLAYLRQREAHLGRLAASLEAAASPRAGMRLAQVRQELVQVGEALDYMAYGAGTCAIG